MTDSGVVQPGMRPARGLLREMADASVTPLEELRRRIEDLMATLDIVLGALPSDTADEVLDFVDQIVTNLYNADVALRQSGQGPALQSLALAEKRIVRLRDLLASLG